MLKPPQIKDNNITYLKYKYSHVLTKYSKIRLKVET